MGVTIDITGQRFGKLMALKLARKRGGNRTWLCQCDCGVKKAVVQSKLRSGHTKSCGCLVRVDLAGKKFGRLTAIEWTGNNNRGSRTWRCMCECGMAKVAAARDLVAGGVKSCGCLMGPDDLTGQRFAKLVAIEPIDIRHNHYIWLCKCDCGESTEVDISKLRSGHTKSCGCLHREGPQPGTGCTHGAAAFRERTPEYVAWSLMNGRCSNPSHGDYQYYGGKGKRVCDRWRESFASFLEDMGPKPGVGYDCGLHLVSGLVFEPGKCRWATPTEIIRGRSNTVFATIKGVSRPFAEWHDLYAPTVGKLGISYHIAYGRFARGWSAHDALTIPVRRPRSDERWDPDAPQY